MYKLIVGAMVVFEPKLVKQLSTQLSVQVVRCIHRAAKSQQSRACDANCTIVFALNALDPFVVLFE